MIDNKIFAGGGLNSDDDPHLLPKNDWVDAQNIRVNSTSDGYLGAVVNIRGTEFKVNVEADGGYTVVGSRGFDDANIGVIFVVEIEGSGNGPKLLVYDASNNTVTTIIDNDKCGGQDVLNLSPNIRINHIDLLDRQYIYWTDGVNPPRMIDRFKDYGTITEQSLSVIKKPPLLPVTPPQIINDPSGAFNNLKDNGYYFKYRYVYFDNSKSAYSPSSRATEQRSRGNACISTALSKVNDSALQFEFDGGGSLVRGLEIIAKANDDGDWMQIANVDFDNITYGPIYRIGAKDFPSYPNVSFIITVAGTPYTITAITGSSDAQGVNNFLDADFDSQSLSGIINKKYVPASNGEGYFEFSAVDPSATFEVTTSDDLYLNLIQVSNVWSKSASDNLFTFTGMKNTSIVDQVEANRPFDYVPLLAGAQCMPNGNYLAYGNYTEGYDNVDVDYEVLQENKSIDRAFLNVAISDIGDGDRKFTFDDTLFNPGNDTFVCRKVINGLYKVSVISNENDTIDTFIERIARSFMYLEGVANVVINLSDNSFTILGTLADNNQWEAEILTCEAAVLLKSYNEYFYGIQYKDDYGRTGAVNFKVGSRFTGVSPIRGEENNYIYTRPVIKINNEAPGWASKYSIVRTKALNASNYVQFSIDDGATQVGDGTIKIPLAPIINYNNSYGAAMNYSFVQGALVILSDSINGRQYFTTLKEISDDNEAIIYQAGIDDLLFEELDTIQIINTNVTSVDDLFFEVGYIGDIINGEHQAISVGDTSQSGSTPATIKLDDGDSFGRNVLMDESGTPFLSGRFLEFYSISDYDNNKLFQNIGNANIVNLFEKQTTYPATVRYSQAYVPGTQINNINSFFETSFQDYSNMYGEIQKLDVDGNMMIVGQKLRMGAVMVFKDLIVDQNNSTLLSNSDKLLNEIRYYDYEAGIGDAPESYVRWGRYIYFVDKRRGLVCRLANNGVTPISITAKMNTFFRDILNSNTAEVLGGFDPTHNEYILTIYNFEDVRTIVFSESNNRFTTYLDVLPSGYFTINQSLYGFNTILNLYEFNASVTYNNFFGVQSNSYITFVSNENPLIKKSFIAINEVASEVWTAPAISTSLSQTSNLIAGDFKNLEGEFHASFLRDSRTTPGVPLPLINGDQLKGKWIQVKLQNSSTDFVYLLSVGVKYIPSPQTGV